MPPKKKGKKKKGKKKGTKKPTTENQPVIKPEALIPKVTLSIRLAAPLAEALAFELNVPINTRLEYIKQKIIEQHGGAVSGVSMCINAYNSSEVLDPNLTLSEVGIPGGGIVKLYYDYKPITHPLLLA